MFPLEGAHRSPSIPQPSIGSVWVTRHKHECPPIFEIEGIDLDRAQASASLRRRPLYSGDSPSQS